MTGTYRFAGVNVRITSLFGDVHALCAGYGIPDGDADMEIRTAMEDIERERSGATDVYGETAGQRASDGYMETLAVYRAIAERMPEHGAVLMHGSAIAVDGNAYLFIASSGTGKSTHTRLWREMLGDRAVMVNDDKPLVSLAGKVPEVYGTPWDGKHRLSSNIHVPLRAVCLLGRAEENSVRPVTAAEAYPVLLQQTFRPADPAGTALTLELIDKLAASAAIWTLRCNMDPEAARVAYGAMSV